MGYRFDLPKIPVNDRPTIFNREMGGWSVFLGFVGACVAAASGLAAGTAAAVACVAVGDALGALYGGAKGRARMERELVDGRPVRQPTVWNAGIWSGLCAFAALDYALLGLTALGGPAIVLGGIVALGFMVAGSWIRHNTMQRDLEKAYVIREREAGVSQQHEICASAGRGPAIYKNSVGAQEAALLDAKQGVSVSQADKVSASRTQHSETQR